MDVTVRANSQSIHFVGWRPRAINLAALQISTLAIGKMNFYFCEKCGKRITDEAERRELIEKLREAASEDDPA